MGLSEPFNAHLWAFPGRGVVMTAVMRWAHELLADTRPESYTWPDGQHRQNGDTVVGRVLWVSRRHFEAANKHKFTGWQVRMPAARKGSGSAGTSSGEMLMGLR